jgi:hypothetical protein
MAREAFGVEVLLGALPRQLVEEARGNQKLFRGAAVAAILEAESYVTSVLWTHTPRGTGLASTLIGFDPPSPYDREPMGYIGWMAPASRYLLFVELGTRPFTPPIGRLMFWAARKFGDASIAWRAMGAIRAKGIRKQLFVKAAADEAQPIASQIMLNRMHLYFMEWGR